MPPVETIMMGGSQYKEEIGRDWRGLEGYGTKDKEEIMSNDNGSLSARSFLC